MLQSFLVLKPKAPFSEVTSVAHTLGQGLEHSRHVPHADQQGPQLPEVEKTKSSQSDFI